MKDYDRAFMKLVNANREIRTALVEQDCWVNPVFSDEEYATLEKIHGELLEIELRLMKSMKEEEK